MDPLRECQRNALLEFEKHYYIDEETRGIVSMCCGSGKTRTIYEMIKFSYMSSKDDNLLFVLATSRTHLIYQIGDDWLKWIKLQNLPFKLRFVGGSGERYNEKTLVGSKAIRREISNCCVYGKKPLIIITTYQSSKNIIEAIDGNSRMYPELVILDEAHNTTGENKCDFQALIKTDNNQFNAEKFVFMTATPVQLLLKNKNAPYTSKETVFSMDNEEIYGKIIYQYSFSEGINDGIITNFKTIYYEKNSDNPMSQELINELKDKTKIEKQNIYFKTICNFVIDSIKLHDLKYILMYCSNQAKAKLMKDEIQAIADGMDFDCWTGTILSDHSKKERSATLKSFEKRNKKPHILFTVGIFDEGVDIKCVDTVCFSEARSSESRIVQNVGRCLRTSPETGKTLGYVIIPNIVHEFESDNISISKTYSSHYKKIRYVLKQMKSPIGNVYWDKFIKSDQMAQIGGIINNDDNDELENMIDMVDDLDIIESNEDDKVVKDVASTKDTINLSQHFSHQSTLGSVANEQLSEIKKLKPQDVTTIRQWCMFAEEKSIPYVLLHKDFRIEWISYGDFLVNNTYKYEEAKEIIKKYFTSSTIHQIKNSEDWVRFFEDTIYREKLDMRFDDVTDTMMKSFIQIPNRPKDYYKGEWKDWEDFLGLQIKPIDKTLTVTLKDKSSGSEKANQNIDVLVNKDQTIIKQYAKGEWNDINVNQVSTDIIKQFLQKRFGAPIDIKYRVCIKKNGSYDKMCINCAYANIGDLFNVPIIIYPEGLKLKYDGNATRKVLTSAEKYNRVEEEYINDPLMKMTLIRIINEGKTQIKKSNDLFKKPNDLSKETNNLSKETNNLFKKTDNSLEKRNEVWQIGSSNKSNNLINLDNKPNDQVNQSVQQNSRTVHTKSSHNDKKQTKVTKVRKYMSENDSENELYDCINIGCNQKAPKWLTSTNVFGNVCKNCDISMYSGNNFIFLNVPFDMHEKVVELGAIWHRYKKQFMISETHKNLNELLQYSSENIPSIDNNE